MFLKPVRPEMDDFERKKALVVKEKYLNKFQYFKKISGTFFYRYICKNLTNIFAYSFVSGHSKHFFLNKNLHFLAAIYFGLSTIGIKNIFWFPLPINAYMTITYVDGT